MPIRYRSYNYFKLIEVKEAEKREHERAKKGGTSDGVIHGPGGQRRQFT